MPKEQTGYDTIYAQLAERLAACNLEAAAPRLGLVPQANGSAVCTLLGREYMVQKGGVFAANGDDADANARSLVAYYALSGGAGEAEGVFAPLSAKGEGMAAAHGSGLPWMEKKLAAAASKDFSSFSKAMAGIGAEYCGKNCLKHTWQLCALPKIPARVVFEEADDEFESAARVLFDTGAARFLTFEQMAFLCGALVQRVLCTFEKA